MISCYREQPKILIPKEFTNNESIYLNGQYLTIRDNCKSCKDLTNIFETKIRLIGKYNNSDSITSLIRFKKGYLSSYSMEFGKLQSKNKVDSLINLLNEKHKNVRQVELINNKYSTNSRTWSLEKYYVELKTWEDYENADSFNVKLEYILIK
jgi:hypothetical protein